MSEGLFVEIDNEIAEIGRVTALLELFGERHDLPEAVVFHMILALDELLTNIISYGFIDAARHKISVSIEIDGDRVAAEISDDGLDFDPLARPAPDVSQPVEERDIGGLGIHFIRTVMDHVDYTRSDGRNYFRMIKKVPPQPAN